MFFLAFFDTQLRLIIYEYDELSIMINIIIIIIIIIISGLMTCPAFQPVSLTHASYILYRR